MGNRRDQKNYKSLRLIFFRVFGVFCSYAPNLSNIFALACMSRIKYFASNTPSEPVLAPVSVNRSSLSEPEYAERSSTGCGCHEWPLMTQGVE